MATQKKTPRLGHPAPPASDERQALLASLHRALDEVHRLGKKIPVGVYGAVEDLAATLATVRAGGEVPPDALKASVRKVASEIATAGSAADPASRAAVNRLLNVVTAVGPRLVGISAARAGGPARSRAIGIAFDDAAPRPASRTAAMAPAPEAKAVRAARREAVGPARPRGPRIGGAVRTFLAVGAGAAAAVAMARAGAPAGPTALAAVGAWLMAAGWLPRHRVHPVNS
jgi:hypothetical protein